LLTVPLDGTTLRVIVATLDNSGFAR